PVLKLLVAHAGGTLPYLAGRLDSCVGTERQIDFALKAAPSEYLKRMYFDSIGYHTPALLALIALVGHERIMFGTDHPFFPPRDATLDLAACLWPSPQENYAAIDDLPAEQQQAILNVNARRIMAL
ncbi:MAG: amidohydrolase family protein, partial [Rhodospirillales bacterium]